MRFFGFFQNYKESFLFGSDPLNGDKVLGSDALNGDKVLGSDPLNGDKVLGFCVFSVSSKIIKKVSFFDFVFFRFLPKL